MNAVDELFGGPEYDHPKLRLWMQRIRAKESAVVEVRQPWNGFSRLQPMLYVEFRSPAGDLVETDSTPWEAGLDLALLSNGVPGRTLMDEARRLSLSLRLQFEPLARRYGDDYFNAVLVEYMRDMQMITRELEQMMPEITTHSPHESPHRDECREDIKAMLGNAARALVQHLGYTKIEATDIIIGALAEYLDARFSITSRRVLGWAHQPEGFWTLVAQLAPTFPGATASVPWRAKATDIALYLRTRSFNALGATVERELLEHADGDSTFPWRVTLDPIAHQLLFTPKV